MARVTYVKAARKSKTTRSCTKCHKPINEGDSYKWFATRIGRYSQRKNFCSSCQIRQSDRTTSPNLQTLYLAIETAEDTLEALSGVGTRDDIAQAVRDAAEGVREVQGMYEESAQNIEDGFGHETYQSSEIREKAEQCESFADELDSAADEIDGLTDTEDEDELLADWEGIDPDDEEALITEYAAEGNEMEEDDTPYNTEDYESWKETKLSEINAEREEFRENRAQEIREEAISLASDALGNCPL